MTTRFDKFQQTNMYQNFNECISWTADKTEAKDFEKYNNNIEYLKNTFDCVGYPDEDQVLFYINDIETIDYEDYEDFKKYIGIIFERSYDTISLCKELINKQNIIDTKNKQKNKIITEKDNLKEIKLQEKEQQRIIKAEIREQNKLRKKQDAENYANEILTCICGFEYVRNKRIYHMSSTRHEFRMEGINFYKHKYPNNINETDDSTISSLDSGK